MISFLMFVGTCILVGWFAQTKRGRTGAAWGAITAVPWGFLWLALDMAEEVQNPDDRAAALALAHPHLDDFSSGLTISIVVGVVMLLIVLTLPKPKQQ